MANRLPMVGWYDPGQLARTAVEVLVSTMFGRHADHRVLEALGRQDFTPHDYTKHADGRPRRSIWVDYVGDVGDGWSSTYAVAYALAQPTLPLTAGGQTIQAPRGDILVFGGDQVYPTASNAEYRRRLLAPYETALRRTPEPHPDAFAIPGNHDWYDSLVSFTRQFCSRRWLGGWQTRQTCSYFALKLPRGWWLLGTDVQLGSDVDAAQVEFFRRVEGQMMPEDRVILCHGEPHWITSAAYEKWDPEASERNLVYLEEKVLGPTINEKQIFTEPTVQARLQSGELDAASAYKIQPGPFNLPYLTLPREINLSGQSVHADHPEVSLSVGGKTYNPEPLIYYAAVLKDAPNSKGAVAFTEWLKGDEAQAIFRKYNYDPPGDASVLHA